MSSSMSRAVGCCTMTSCSLIWHGGIWGLGPVDVWTRALRTRILVSRNAVGLDNPANLAMHPASWQCHR